MLLSIKTLFIVIPLVNAVNDFNSVPKCAQSCLIDLPAGCSISNSKCLCSNVNWILQFNCCTLKCNPNDQQETLLTISAICVAEDAQLPDAKLSCSVPTSTSTSATSASTSTSTSSKKIDIVTITSTSTSMRSHKTEPPIITPSTTPPPQKKPSSSTGLPRTATIAMSVSIPVAAISLALLGYRLHRHARSSRMQHVDHVAGTSLYPISDTDTHRLRPMRPEAVHQQQYHTDEYMGNKDWDGGYDRSRREDHQIWGVQPQSQDLDQNRRATKGFFGRAGELGS